MKRSVSSSNNLYNLVAKNISGQASDKDKQRVEEWIKSSPEAYEEYADLEKLWKTRYFAEEDIELISQQETSEQIWESVFKHEEKKTFIAINRSFFIRVAAVLIFFFAATFILLYTIDNKPLSKLSTITIQKQTLPGQKSTIPLPDGSIVYLNSGSKISYKSDFNDKLRIIDLEGEAFFDIFKNKEKPFIVRCRELEIEALGTSFDVNGLNSESVQVSLVRGRVKLYTSEMPESNTLILNPGEYSIMDKEYNIIKKGKFDPYEVLAWKNGRLIFNEATLKEIIPKLEMWYGVKIDNQTNRLSNKHFNSTFEKENLDNILCNMGLSMGFTHKIQGNVVTLINKTPM